jgi:hypothetical protein
MAERLVVPTKPGNSTQSNALAMASFAPVEGRDLS